MPPPRFNGDRVMTLKSALVMQLDGMGACSRTQAMVDRYDLDSDDCPHCEPPDAFGPNWCCRNKMQAVFNVLAVDVNHDFFTDSHSLKRFKFYQYYNYLINEIPPYCTAEVPACIKQEAVHRFPSPQTTYVHGPHGNHTAGFQNPAHQVYAIQQNTQERIQSNGRSY